MPPDPVAEETREFLCVHCGGKVLVPRNLPPTTGPCPICGKTITSPGASPGAATGSDQTTAVLVGLHETIPRPILPPPDATGPDPTGPESSTASASERPTSSPRKSGNRAAPVLVLIILGGLVAGTWFALQSIRAKQSEESGERSAEHAARQEMQYLSRGWQSDAFDVLAGFLAAKTPAAKAAYTIEGRNQLARMESFYQGTSIDDSDTPAAAFSVSPLPLADRQRGIFMLVYDQPPAFEINEFFRPLAPLDVNFGLRDADILLSTVARSSNFTAEPLKVHAFFKRVPGGLRLDWDSFVQTKHRMFRDFLELPVEGRADTFRVIISETVPEKRNVLPGSRTYLVTDPAYFNEDSVKVNVMVDSEIGRAISRLNWLGSPEGRAELRTATLELRWTREEIPQVEISRFICWEFLGLGGEPSEPTER